jgi:flagellar basal body-associated protein FliL
MAEETTEGGGAAPAPKRGPPPLVLINTVLVLIALGTLVYTKLLFHRPEISESTELQKKKDELKAPPVVEPRSIVSFDQFVVNIAMTSGKAHYATIAFAVECRDSHIEAIVNAKKALFLDKIISALAHRQMTELNTIQGKLLFKTDLMRDFSALTEPGGITDIYFSNFVLQ